MRIIELPTYLKIVSTILSFICFSAY